MRLLCCFILLLVAAHVACGNPYPGKDHSCNKWSCINGKLNQPDRGPSSELTGFLNIPDDWKTVANRAAIKCKENTHRGNMNTCPGQDLLHCFITELNMNCPEKYSKNTDFCSPLRSRASAASTYMFSQSRYDNFEEYVAIEQRPHLFMRSYLNNKCCAIPKLFNNSVIEECGFEELIHYHNYVPLRKYLEYETYIETTAQETNIINDSGEKNGNGEDDNQEELDPLDCCIVDEFIHPKWRSDCNFKLKWNNFNRLTILNESEVMTTTKAPSLRNKDVKIVPLPCNKQHCIFNKLNITTDGVVNKDAFSKLLDSMTHRHTEWTTAKAKVVTQCLNKPLIGYDGDCEINQILACTFDILTENCPNTNKNDPCKHSTTVLDGLICQISSSKFRPRHRRQFCDAPDLVGREVREECGLSLEYRLEYVPEASPLVQCKVLSQQTTCLLNKMNVLNKYGFIDHFKMTDGIAFFAKDFPPHLQSTYKNAFNNAALYPHECSSAKKLLNVIDSMIRTCPHSQLKQEQKCLKLRAEIKHSQLNERFQRNLGQASSTNLPLASTQKFNKKPLSLYKTNHLFNFGIFGSDNAPEVNTIDLKTEKTLVLLPVYESYKKPQKIFSLHNDGILRS